MLQIVIPLHQGGGREKNNIELRYALRSWETNLTDPFEVTIVGRSLPAWLTGVRHIKQSTPYGLKDALRKAADAYPDGFIWTYDDTFVIKPTTADEVKIPVAKATFHTGTPNAWNEMLMRIHARLVEEGIPPLDVSRPHCPYWFDKSMVEEGFNDWPGMTAKFPWETWIISKRRIPVRTGLEKQYYSKKFGGPPEPHHAFINCSDAGWTAKLKRCLDTAFPTPSRFEKKEEAPPIHRNLLFVHVPKTGGTSIRKALGFEFRVRNTSHFPSNHPEFRKLVTPASTVFAVVRNPYDRAWSVYKFFHRKKMGSPRIDQVFRSFVQAMTCDEFWLHPNLQEFIRLMPHLKTQSSWIKNADVKILRFENLAEEWAAIAPGAGPLPRIQASPGPSWETSLSPEVKKVIAKIYAEDFKRFGYTP